MRQRTFARTKEREDDQLPRAERPLCELASDMRIGAYANGFHRAMNTENVRELLEILKQLISDN